MKLFFYRTINLRLGSVVKMPYASRNKETYDMRKLFTVCCAACFLLVLAIVSQAQVDLRFYGNRTDFQTKSPIHFTLTNNGTGTIMLGGNNPWEVFDTSGNSVFAPISAFFVIFISPGQSYDWTWNQQNMAGQFVPISSYRLVLKYTDQFSTASTVSLFFTISSSSHGK